MAEEKKKKAAAPAAPAGAPAKPKVKKRKPSILKRVRQEKRKREHNSGIKKNLKATLKNTELAIASKDKQKIKEALSLAFSTLDKTARSGVIHKNKAARHKSRLALKANKI